MSKDEKQEVDIYRDTPVRLLGYANEVGEAFRALVHVNWVRASYGVASLYVLADTRDKALKMMTKTDSASDEAEKRKKVAAAAFDTLLWQVSQFGGCSQVLVTLALALAIYRKPIIPQCKNC